jgi:hypothetical protein
VLAMAQDELIAQKVTPKEIEVALNKLECAEIKRNEQRIISLLKVVNQHGLDTHKRK